ncbi:MAG: AAA family ATPase, partial [Pseudomonadota bacterium]
MSAFKRLIDRLKAHQTTIDEPFLVAIDGKSGVGKSTLAQRLSQQFASVVISGDDFYAGGTGLLRDDPETLAQICIDRVRLGSVLQQLKSDQSAKYTPFDWTA